MLGSEGFGKVAELSRGRFSAQHEARAARGDVADGTAAAQPPQAVDNKQLDYVDYAVAPAGRLCSQHDSRIQSSAALQKSIHCSKHSSRD